MDEGTRTFSAGLRRQADAGGYRLLAPEDAWQRVSAGSLAVVDVRDARDYEAGHVPGALCFPLPMTWVARLLRRWWLRRVLCAAQCPVVAFVCDGTATTRSDAAARAAVVQEFAEVYRVAGGMEAWRAAGLPVECGSCVVPAGGDDAAYGEDAGDASARGGGASATGCKGG